MPPFGIYLYYFDEKNGGAVFFLRRDAACLAAKASGRPRGRVPACLTRVSSTPYL